MRTVVAMWVLSRTCTPLEPVPTDTDPETEGTDVSPGTDDPDTDPGTDPLPPGNMETLSGTLTWSLDFDAEAEDAGFTDCTYRRAYTAEEDATRPWLCPSCDVIFRADATFQDGEADCYRQLTANRAPPNELLGRTAGRWWRARDWNLALVDMGPAALTTPRWTVSASGTVPHTVGSVAYTITGELARSRREGDLHHGLTPPDTYACGWSRTERPDYTGDHTLAVGAPLPDAVFVDACGEPVRLYDLFDGYLVLYTATTDCLQCRQMALDQPAFEAEVAGLGWDVTIVTLLSPSLQDAAGDVSPAAMSTWVGGVGLGGRPVLADRGYGFHVMGPTFPRSVVVDPDGIVVDVADGYAGSWDYWGLQIDQDLHGQD